MSVRLGFIVIFIVERDADLLHVRLFWGRYFLGLLTATVSSEVFKAAQPALLYLVPFTLLPLLTMAYLKVTLPDPALEAWK